MGVTHQRVTARYALYHADCMEVMPTFPAGSMHLSIYSPPFGGLYHYSSDERDLSNSLNYNEFFEHYTFVVKEIHRLTMPGRMSAVHCMDIPTGNTGLDHLKDFPGDVIRLHERLGFEYAARYHVWKEPLTVRNRTMTKSLSHKMVTVDSTRCSIANADYLLIFRRAGKNTIPVAHPSGLTEYAGARRMPAEFSQYRGWKGSQLENRFSHWIWRQYASAFWDDVRLDRVLPYSKARDSEDEKHVHPLQLDVIERGLVLWSNPGENVLTPFMGIGSEAYASVRLGRRAVGIELKPSYFAQALRNVQEAETHPTSDQMDFEHDTVTPGDDLETPEQENVETEG